MRAVCQHCSHAAVKYERWLPLRPVCLQPQIHERARPARHPVERMIGLLVTACKTCLEFSSRETELPRSQRLVYRAQVPTHCCASPPCSTSSVHGITRAIATSFRGRWGQGYLAQQKRQDVAHGDSREVQRLRAVLAEVGARRQAQRGGAQALGIRKGQASHQLASLVD